MNSNPTPEFIALLSTLVLTNLDDSLLKPKYLKADKHPLFGHCYAASEAMFYLLGGKRSCYRSKVLRLDKDNTHWYLVNLETGENLDLTAAQFEEPLQYENGRGCGFLTSTPSSRANTILKRVNKKLVQLGHKPIVA